MNVKTGIYRLKAWQSQSFLKEIVQIGIYVSCVYNEGNMDVVQC